MESKRQQQYAKLIRKDMGDLFNKIGRDIYGNNFVTVTEVKMTPDLSLAKIYVSVLAASDKQQVVARINQRKGELRGHLGRKIGKQVRIVPDIQFYLDDTLDTAEKMDKIFKDLHIPPSAADDQED